jgi:hypothetical protein
MGYLDGFLVKPEKGKKGHKKTWGEGLYGTKKKPKKVGQDIWGK